MEVLLYGVVIGLFIGMAIASGRSGGVNVKPPPTTPRPPPPKGQGGSRSVG